MIFSPGKIRLNPLGLPAPRVNAHGEGEKSAIRALAAHTHAL
jgi:hypothetical protein